MRMRASSRSTPDRRKASPGVVAVLTGADLKADGIGAFPTGAGLKRADGQTHVPGAPHHALAVESRAIVGEPVAAVFAQTRDQAEDAVEQVMVEYKELPAVVTIEAATAKGAPLLWPDAPGNVAAQTEFGRERPVRCRLRQGQARHQVVLLYNQRLIPVSMEPRGSVAEFDAAAGRVTLPPAARTRPACRKRSPAESASKCRWRVRVVVGDVGGGFGMKTQCIPRMSFAPTPRASSDAGCAGARRRSEEFLAGSHGRDQNNEAELAFDADGKILGFRP